MKYVKIRLSKEDLAFLEAHAKESHCRNAEGYLQRLVDCAIEHEVMAVRMARNEPIFEISMPDDERQEFGDDDLDDDIPF